MSEDIKKLTKYVKESRDLIKDLEVKIDYLTVKSDKQDEMLNEILEELKTLLVASSSDEDEDESTDDDDSSTYASSSDEEKPE